jgi:hypothetical protein
VLLGAESRAFESLANGNALASTLAKIALNAAVGVPVQRALLAEPMMAE